MTPPRVKKQPIKKDLAVKRFRTQAAWERWLSVHHETAPGIWLEFAKKNSGVPSVSYAEALEVALCYGWIDGQTASVDAVWYRQRFTPRRPKSKWSQINRAAVEKLHAAGRLSPAGIREMVAAKKDGRWEAAYGGSRELEVPADLAEALAAEPRAQAMFDILTSANRFAVVYRVTSPKRPETRARRIAQLVEQLARGETIYPQKRTL